MNLRQIDEFLEKHSAGWKPFKGDFRITKSSFRNNPLDDLVGRDSMIGHVYRGISDLGDAGGQAVGYKTPQVKEGERMEALTAENAARKAAHDAEVARLAEGSLGAIALRRRRGSMATMLTGSSMGGNLASTGKTLLSQ
jgi:hypothetical protein